jgi:hypothetical protein
MTRPTNGSPDPREALRPAAARAAERTGEEQLRVEISDRRERLGELAEEIGQRLESAQTTVKKGVSPVLWLKHNKRVALIGAGVAASAALVIGIALSRTRLVRTVLAVVLRRPGLLLSP